MSIFGVSEKHRTMTMIKLTFTVVSSLLLATQTHAYVPGVAAKDFQKGDDVPLKVNALTSTHTQIPLDYYKLPFCEPSGGPEMASENLGEFLTGNKIQSSPYMISMLEEVYCQKVCMTSLTELTAGQLRKTISRDYHNNWIIDNLPSAAIGFGTKGEEKKRYAGGFPIGFYTEDKKVFIYNHVNIHVDYHASTEGRYRVVGFAVEPISIKHEFEDRTFQWNGKDEVGMTKPLITCPKEGKHMFREQASAPQEVAPNEGVIFTYDVTWTVSEIEWTSRWDVYLSEDHLVPAKVHWYSITNSILVVLFLSILVISILVRNLRRDIAAYNALAVLADEEMEEEADETGWKLVHADVFRPPQSGTMLFCVFCGSGAQIGLTTFFAIVFSAVGFLSPARRGSLMLAFLILYMLLGVVAGYISSRLYKAFRGRQWQLCTVMTAILFPGMTFGVFVLFNVILYFLDSSGSAPFLDVIILAAMWCGVSIPLVFFGAYFGYKEKAMEFPTVTSTIARAIPTPPALLHPIVGMILTGIIPFAAAYVELFFIMTSLWMDQFYYVFGFTLIVYLILVITCAEVTLLLVYYQLCAENHRWWWYSFFCSGSTAFYTFVYSIFWFRTLHVSSMLMTYMLYFGYMFLISFGMLLLFGTVGALASLWFLRTIFGTIKVD